MNVDGYEKARRALRELRDDLREMERRIELRNDVTAAVNAAVDAAFGALVCEDNLRASLVKAIDSVVVQKIANALVQPVASSAAIADAIAPSLSRILRGGPVE